MRELVLVGGGGHARACLDVIEAAGYLPVGILDRDEAAGNTLLGVPVIGTDAEMESLVARGVSFLVAVGQIGISEVRRCLFAQLVALGADLPAIIAPTARVSPHAAVGRGTIVMHIALIGPAAQVGENCIINSRALVEHDACIGNHCHVATGAVVNGGCLVEEGSFIGSGALLKQGIRIGRQAVVGMGAVVRRDVADGEVVR